MMENNSVIVVGSCMTDLISYVPRFPGPGETLQGNKFLVGFGGKGANQCVMASRLGIKSHMVALVGDDTYGKNYIKNFKENSVDIKFVKVTDKAATGVAPITVDSSGQNSIIIVPGANLEMTREYVRSAADIFTSGSVLICQFEITMDATEEALEIAKKNNVKSILNAAPAIPDPPKKLFQLCDIFCVNESEAEILTGVKVAKIEDAELALKKFLKFGCNIVILTMGEKGAVFLSKTEKKPQYVPSPVVKVTDTTGAGDSFVGALAYYLAKFPGLSIEEMISRSCEIASISVQRSGTQSSFPFRHELPQALFS